jgi:hypothetical protein
MKHIPRNTVAIALSAGLLLIQGAAEGHISQTGNRTAVMQELPDFVSAFSHHAKPLMRDGSQFTRMLSSRHRWREPAQQRR